MKNKNLKEILKENNKLSDFLSSRLYIDTKLNIIDNELLYSTIKSTIAYSNKKGNIWLDRNIKKIMYFVLEDSELYDLKEGCRFIINHEIGHFHDMEHKNPNVEKYFKKLMEIACEDDRAINAFSEAEATRYALSLSENWVKALSGFFAIHSFLYKADIYEAIKDLERYFDDSNTEVNRKITRFKLSSGNIERIQKTSESYLEKLKSRLKLSLLYGVKEKELK